MKKIVITMVVLLLVAGVAFYIMDNNRKMQQLQEAIAKQNNHTSLVGNSENNTVGTLGAITNTTRPGTELARASMVAETMTQGWKLINNRSAASAHQAEQIFREALVNIDSQNPLFYNGLGRALLLQNQFRAAAQTWKKGFSLAAQLPVDQKSEFYSGLGWAYWNLQDFARAKSAWEQAVKINPKSIDAWSALAWIELGLGNFDHARDGFQILYAHDSKNNNWLYGMNMARSHNSRTDQIAIYFILPPLESFTHPLANDPADEPATIPATAPTH